MTNHPQAATESPTEPEAPEAPAEAVAELREILAELRRQRFAIIGLAVALFAIVAIGGLYLNDKARDAELNRKALCTFRADLEARVTASRDFLIEHPGGIPGIPEATIQKSIHDQERTIRALAPLPCPPPPRGA